MPAPSPSARTEPDGVHLEKGRRILYNFSLASDIALWEISATPFSLQAPDMVQQTTQWNETVETFAPGSLIRVGDASVKCAYDPAVISTILSIINQEGVITEHQPDGSSICAYGILRSFTRDEMSPPNQPQATVVFGYTNRDPVSHDEELPVYTPPPPPPPPGP